MVEAINNIYKNNHQVQILFIIHLYIKFKEGWKNYNDTRKLKNFELVTLN